MTDSILSKKQAVLLVFCGFWVNGMIMGPMKSIGVFFLPYQENYNANAQEASLVSSLMYGLYFFSGPFASISCHVIGYKYTAILGSVAATLSVAISCFANMIEILYLTMGALFGFGACLAITPIYALIGQIFSDKRPLVNNIITMGSGVSGVPLSFALQYWVDSYGLRGSILLMAGVLFNSLPAILTAVIMGSKTDVPMTTAKKKIMDFKILKTPGFPFYCLGCGFHIASIIAVGSYLIRYAQANDIGNYEAASLSSIISATDMCVRPISGYITSLPRIGRVPVSRFHIMVGSIFLQAVVTFVFPFVSSYPALVAATVAYSVCLGFCGALTITMLADLFGVEKLATSLGLRSMVAGIFSFVTPPLIGLIVDTTGKYSSAFYLSSAFALTATLQFYFVRTCFVDTEKNGVQENNANT